MYLYPLLFGQFLDRLAEMVLFTQTISKIGLRIFCEQRQSAFSKPHFIPNAPQRDKVGYRLRLFIIGFEYGKRHCLNLMILSVEY
jgi:hypothetical protein